MSRPLLKCHTGRILLACWGFTGTRRWFVVSAAVILSLAGLAKVCSSFGTTRLLTEVDPVFGVKFRQMMMAVGLLEIAIALVCVLAVFKKWSSLSLALVAWIATSFLAYRVGLALMDWHRPCNCLGGLTESIGIPPAVADSAMKCVAIYLLAGSYALLFMEWRPGNRVRVDGK